MSNTKNILTKEVASQKLQRLTLEIAEQLDGIDTELIIIGIQNNGVVIANLIAKQLKKYVSFPITTASLLLDKDLPTDVTLSQPIDFNQKNVLICDDVSNSGRTLLYALKPILAFHPKSIQTLVLVERMHKQFPVKPDYVGLSLSTTLQEHIKVVVNNDEIEGAYID